MELLTDLAATGATGRFGILRPGAPLAAVLAAYGEPQADEPAYRAREWPRWLSYGSVRLSFCRCRLLDQVIIPTRPEGLELPGPGHRRVDGAAVRITEPQMAAALGAAGCAWELRESWNIGHDRMLRTTPADADGVTVSFTFAFAGPRFRASQRPDEWLLRTVVLGRPAEHDCPDPGGA